MTDSPDHRRVIHPTPRLATGWRWRRRFISALGLTLALLAPGPFDGRAAMPWTAPADAASVQNAVPSTPDSIRRGKSIYQDRCADCHGRKGRGDGSGGVDLECKPTDLTAATLSSQSDGALFWKLTQGRKPMPAYARKLSEEERWHVINFIRTLAPKPKQKPTAP